MLLFYFYISYKRCQLGGDLSRAKKLCHAIFVFPLTSLRHVLGALWHATPRSTENTQESTFGASYDLHLDHIRQDVPALFKMFQNGKPDR